MTLGWQLLLAGKVLRGLVLGLVGPPQLARGVLWRVGSGALVVVAWAMYGRSAVLGVGRGLLAALRSDAGGAVVWAMVSRSIPDAPFRLLMGRGCRFLLRGSGWGPRGPRGLGARCLPRIPVCGGLVGGMY